MWVSSNGVYGVYCNYERSFPGSYKLPLRRYPSRIIPWDSIPPPFTLPSSLSSALPGKIIRTIWPRKGEDKSHLTYPPIRDSKVAKHGALNTRRNFGLSLINPAESVFARRTN